MIVYTDSDYVSDIDDRKNNTGSILMMSSRAICWFLNKQPRHS